MNESFVLLFILCIIKLKKDFSINFVFMTTSELEQDEQVDLFHNHVAVFPHATHICLASCSTDCLHCFLQMIHIINEWSNMCFDIWVQKLGTAVNLGGVIL